MDKQEGFMNIDPKEIANYIFTKLLAVGAVVKREDIELILELEMEYMHEMGIGMIVFEEVDED